MATIIIALRNDIFNYSFRFAMDGVAYPMTLRYNRRVGDGTEQADGSWILNFDNVLNGIRLCGGQDLLGQFHHLEVPPGELRVVDLDEEFKEPDRTNFSDRVVLQYTEV
jgi:hypothetical protein